MDKEECKQALAEIGAQFLARESALGWSIARELADFTVTFVAESDGDLAPAGTGTLVSFRDSHYFLTARHVWEDALKQCDLVRIPLKENSPCRFAIRPDEIFPWGPMTPSRWNEWGPDVALLQIPQDRVGSFTAVGRLFFPLSIKRERQLDCSLETTFLMGAPALRGTFSTEMAIPELQGMNVILDSGCYSSLALSMNIRPQFDYVDVLIDTTQPDVASSFEGVSGGGLWTVYLYPGANGEIQNFKTLSGVAFWQEYAENSALRVRCHGPQSLGAVLCQLYE